MNHASSAIADFYDHEQEPVQGRRHRPNAPDWGGDDLFTTTTTTRRRRFDRPTHGDHGRLVLETLEQPVRPAVAPDVAELEFTTIAAHDLAVEAPRVVGGRRTVTVTGHPGGLAGRRR